MIDIELCDANVGLQPGAEGVAYVRYCCRIYDTSILI